MYQEFSIWSSFSALDRKLPVNSMPDSFVSRAAINDSIYLVSNDSKSYNQIEEKYRQYNTHDKHALISN